MDYLLTRGSIANGISVSILKKLPQFYCSPTEVAQVF